MASGQRGEPVPLWGVWKVSRLEGIPLLGVYGEGGGCGGVERCAYSTIKDPALLQIPTQKRASPMETDKPFRALFMKFHSIPL